MKQKERKRLRDLYSKDRLGAIKLSLIEQMYANKTDDVLLAKLAAALYVLQDDYQSAVQCMLERDNNPNPDWLSHVTSNVAPTDMRDTAKIA